MMIFKQLQQNLSSLPQRSPQRLSHCCKKIYIQKCLMIDDDWPPGGTNADDCRAYVYVCILLLLPLLLVIDALDFAFAFAFFFWLLLVGCCACLVASRYNRAMMNRYHSSHRHQCLLTPLNRTKQQTNETKQRLGRGATIYVAAAAADIFLFKTSSSIIRCRQVWQKQTLLLGNSSSSYNN